MVLKGEPLFEVLNDTILDGTIESKKDTLVVATNKSIMNTINHSPEEKNSWILKVRDIETESNSYGKFLKENPDELEEEKRKAIKEFYISTYSTPYTYHSSPNDYKTYSNKYDSVYQTNANENDLISGIMSNH